MATTKFWRILSHRPLQGGVKTHLEIEVDGRTLDQLRRNGRKFDLEPYGVDGLEIIGPILPANYYRPIPVLPDWDLPELPEGYGEPISANQDVPPSHDVSMTRAEDQPRGGALEEDPIEHQMGTQNYSPPSRGDLEDNAAQQGYLVTSDEPAQSTSVLDGEVFSPTFEEELVKIVEQNCTITTPSKPQVVSVEILGQTPGTSYSDFKAPCKHRPRSAVKGRRQMNPSEFGQQTCCP